MLTTNQVKSDDFQKLSLCEELAHISRIQNPTNPENVNIIPLNHENEVLSDDDTRALYLLATSGNEIPQILTEPFLSMNFPAISQITRILIERDIQVRRDIQILNELLREETERFNYLSETLQREQSCQNNNNNNQLREILNIIMWSLLLAKLFDYFNHHFR